MRSTHYFDGKSEKSNFSNRYWLCLETTCTQLRKAGEDHPRAQVVSTDTRPLSLPKSGCGPRHITRPDMQFRQRASAPEIFVGRSSGPSGFPGAAPAHSLQQGVASDLEIRPCHCSTEMYWPASSKLTSSLYAYSTASGGFGDPGDFVLRRGG